MKRNKSLGISLIVLVISILVMIILAGAIIITLAKTNIIEKAEKAKFIATYKSLEEALQLKISDKYMENPNITTEEIDDISISTLAPDLNEETANKFSVENRNIILTDFATDEEKQWIAEYQNQPETSEISYNIHYGDIAPTDTTKLWIKTTAGNQISNGYEDKLSSLSIETLESSYNLPTAVYGASCITYNGKIYMFGGYTTAYLNTIRIYDPSTGTITTSSATLSKGIYESLVLLCNGYMYIYGGETNGGSRSSTIYRYNPITDTVETLSIVLAEASSGTFGSTYENKMYIIGGKPTSNTRSNKVQVVTLDNSNNATIETLSTVTLPSSGFGSVAAVENNGKIYIFGGSPSPDTSQNTIYVYDILNNTINSAGQLNISVNVSSIVLDNNYIYVCGGWTSGYVTTTAIQKYDIINKTTETISMTLPYGNGAAGFAKYNYSLYMLGGYSNGTVYNKVTKMTISKSDLEETNIYIYENSSSDIFKLIGSDGTSKDIKPCKVYKGDSNGKAEWVEAYIYNTNTSTWELIN